MTEQYQGIGRARIGASLRRETEGSSPRPSFAQSQLASFLTSGNEEHPIHHRLQEGRALRPAFAELPEHLRTSIEARFGCECVEELLALSEEGHGGLFFQGLIHLGQRQLNQRPEVAAALFAFARDSLAGDFPGRPENHRELSARAQRELDAIEGRGAIGARVEFLSRHFVREAANPIAIAGMAVGGMAFSLARAGFLANLLARPAGLLTRGLGARALASGLGFGVELPAFVFSSRALHEAVGQRQDWSLRGTGQELAMAGITLGALKLSGAGVHGLLGRRPGVTALQRGMRLALPQFGMYGAIVLAHAAEERLGLRPTVDGGTRFVDAFNTLLQFNVAGRLMEGALGPRYSAVNRELHLRSERMAATPRFELPMGLRGLGPQWVSANGAASSPRTNAPGLFSPILMMENNGNNKGGGGPAPRRPTPIVSRPVIGASGRESQVKISPLVPGTRLGPGVDGRFEIKERIGEGGAGIIYRAKDRRSQRDVALKVPRGRADQATLDRINREIFISENLGSGWAVPIYDHFEFPPKSGVQIMVMEYVDGRSFADLLYLVATRNPEVLRDFPLERRIDLFADFCLGVHDAHQHGVTHNDLKPENMRVDRNLHMRILDWGLAKHVRLSTKNADSLPPTSAPGERADPSIEHSELGGTPGYIAPELIVDLKSSNRRSPDIFALGVVLYEAATGLHPFGVYRSGDKSRGEPSLMPEWDLENPRVQKMPDNVTMLYVARDDFRPPAFREIMVGEYPSYLAEIENISLKAMSRDPKDRYQTAAELREAVLMARARADRESLRSLQVERRDEERHMTDTWDWRIFNVASKANPGRWAQGERTIRQLREMRESWHQGVEELVTRLHEVTKFERIPAAHRMIAEISWERLVDGGDRMAEGVRRALERRIRENDFEITRRDENGVAVPTGRYFSEVLEGRARIHLEVRSTDPELDPSPRVRITPWVREVDSRGNETGTFGPGETLIEGTWAEIGRDLRLPVGYYDFSIYEPGFAPMNLPVQVTREAVHAAVVRGEDLPLQLTLVPRERVPMDMVVVQGGLSQTGWDFYHDGMPSNVYSFPMRGIELPTFAISRNPITVGEYAKFIEALLSRRDVASALEFMPRKGAAHPASAVRMPQEVARIFEEEARSESRNYYWSVETTMGEQGIVYRLVDPTTHRDPNRDPIFSDQPISAITREAADAYIRWRAERDGFPYRMANADEKEKVDRQSFPWIYPWGYDSAPFFVISRLTFQGDRNLTTFPQPIGRHPLGSEHYRDFTIYGTRDNLGNVREFTSSEGEPNSVVISGGSVRVPYGPFYLPAGRNYPVQTRQVTDSIGAFRLALDLDQAVPTAYQSLSSLLGSKE